MTDERAEASRQTPESIYGSFCAALWGALQYERQSDFFCTRPRGHVGPHEARITWDYDARDSEEKADQP